MIASVKKHFDGRPIRKDSSRFKGVHLQSGKQGKKPWRAVFFLAKAKASHLGVFATEEEAARAYDEAALRYRGPNAFQNMRDLELKTGPIVVGDVTRVPLADGRYFLIDTADLDQVGRYYWNDSPNSVNGTCGMEDRTSLHSLLVGPLTRLEGVIHLNADPLDFRRSNLEVVPWMLHFGRHRKQAGFCRSIYKGVKRRSENSWHARIGRLHIGAFDNEVDAALAFDAAAREKYGKYVAVNFPREGEACCLRDEPPAQLAA